jgi:hypothetical protein
MINYADRPCRINTYGDSFTQGHQVSDGETWQEYLAAHFGEPVRNFGIGGYGVYQAYRRMVREEATASAAEYLVLNIYGLDDHLRSIDSWRWLRFGEGWRTRPEHRHMFHGNPWAHVRLDPRTGKLVELENRYATRESLYKLADKDYVYENFHDDLIVKLLLAQRKGTGVNLKELEALATGLSVRADFSSPDAIAETARGVHIEYALRAGMHIVEKARAFALEKKKKLMVLLSYDSGTVRRACEGLPRVDSGQARGGFPELSTLAARVHQSLFHRPLQAGRKPFFRVCDKGRDRRLARAETGCLPQRQRDDPSVGRVLDLSVGRLLRPSGGRVLEVLLPPIGCHVKEAIGVGDRFGSARVG